MKKIIKTFILGTAILGGISLSEVIAMDLGEMDTPKEEHVGQEDTKAALLDAVHNKNVEKLKSLIDKVPNVDDIKDNQGNTALHIAVQEDSLEIVKILVANKANINAQNSEGSTPLHIAVKNGIAKSNSIAIVEFLISKGADITMLDNKAYMPLHYAALENTEEIAKDLINEDTINAQGSSGKTPLHIAAQANNAIIGEFLIDNGAKVDSREDNGFTPLHEAAWKNSLGMAELLINEETINALDNEGHTPLYWANQHDCKDVAELLKKTVGMNNHF